jgi:hypothetical protein
MKVNFHKMCVKGAFAVGVALTAGTSPAADLMASFEMALAFDP